MKKLLFLVIFLNSIVFGSEYSLKGATKTINISANTVDKNKVLQQVDEKFDRFDFTKLKKDKDSVKKHFNRVEKIKSNLKKLADLRTKIELNAADIAQLNEDLEEAKKRYTKKMNRVYRKNKYLDRYFYIVVATKNDVDYINELDNYLVDNYAIKRYEQTTTVKKTSQELNMQNIIKTQKDFGQKSIETLYEYIDRENKVKIKLLKVTQNPFIKSKRKKINEDEKVSSDYIVKKLKIFDLKNTDFDAIALNLDELGVSDLAIKEFILNASKKADKIKYIRDFAVSSKKIKKVLDELEKLHTKESSKIANIISQLNMLRAINKDLKKYLDKILNETKILVKPYKIPLTKETIGSITIATPKTYSEYVDLDEEKDFIKRKVRAYISKITVSDIEQSETLINFSDLSTSTKIKHKSIKFETIHILPYLDDKNKLGVFIFASISIKENLSEDDLLTFKFKYDKIRFIPFQKGLKTIFAMQTKVTLGIVKEFLQTHKFKDYFDSICVDDSILPEEAKDFKNVSSEYYKYPAICFNVDRVEEFVKWMSKKIKRKLVIPEVSDWIYVATNSGTTKYCWGNEAPEDLVDKDRLPENIYLEERDEQTTIEKVDSREKSLSGIYGMCGNTFEMVKVDGELGYKGNSYLSYVEDTSGEAEDYEDEINSMLGLRLFYIEGEADE